MNSALIGHTGFVGSNLLRQGTFEDTYNSTNIQSIAGKSYDTVWCAGVRAVKWWANQNPEEDKKGIEHLTRFLSHVKCKYFVLISTVDVFKAADGVTENTAPSADGLHPYGRHRLELEAFVASKFPSYSIIRLPGLFGEGLKKNIIYDFLYDNEVHKINSKNSFQFYDLNAIYKDCCKVIEAALPLCHFATEPVSVADVALNAFGVQFENIPEGSIPVHYDMRTLHAARWNKPGPYLYDRQDVLESIASFVYRKRRQ